jgi:hypothetical protein
MVTYVLSYNILNLKVGEYLENYNWSENHEYLKATSLSTYNEQSFPGVVINLDDFYDGYMNSVNGNVIFSCQKWNLQYVDHYRVNFDGGKVIATDIRNFSQNKKILQEIERKKLLKQFRSEFEKEANNILKLSYNVHSEGYVIGKINEKLWEYYKTLEKIHNAVGKFWIYDSYDFMVKNIKFEYKPNSDWYNFSTYPFKNYTDFSVNYNENKIKWKMNLE